MMDISWFLPRSYGRLRFNSTLIRDGKHGNAMDSEISHRAQRTASSKLAEPGKDDLLLG